MTMRNSLPRQSTARPRTLGERIRRPTGYIDRKWLLWSFVCLLAFAPLTAQASIFKGEALDKAADVLTIVILIFVPIAAIAVFWMVHVIPEKIAEKRHHPQQTAIKTLCLLSLVFGGMLWPIAWLWAYTKPVGYKMAYGTDKHDNYFKEALEHAEQGRLSPTEAATVHEELDELAARGLLTPELRAVRDRLAALNKPVPKQPAAVAQPQPAQSAPPKPEPPKAEAPKPESPGGAV